MKINRKLAIAAAGIGVLLLLRFRGSFGDPPLPPDPTPGVYNLVLPPVLPDYRLSNAYSINMESRTNTSIEVHPNLSLVASETGTVTETAIHIDCVRVADRMLMASQTTIAALPASGDERHHFLTTFLGLQTATDYYFFLYCLTTDGAFRMSNLRRSTVRTAS